MDERELKKKKKGNESTWRNYTWFGGIVTVIGLGVGLYWFLNHDSNHNDDNGNSNSNINSNSNSNSNNNKNKDDNKFSSIHQNQNKDKNQNINYANKIIDRNQNSSSRSGSEQEAEEEEEEEEEEKKHSLNNKKSLSKKRKKQQHHHRYQRSHDHGRLHNHHEHHYRHHSNHSQYDRDYDYSHRSRGHTKYGQRQHRSKSHGHRYADSNYDTDGSIEQNRSERRGVYTNKHHKSRHNSWSSDSSEEPKWGSLGSSKPLSDEKIKELSEGLPKLYEQTALSGDSYPTVVHLSPRPDPTNNDPQYFRPYNGSTASTVLRANPPTDGPPLSLSRPSSLHLENTRPPPLHLENTQSHFSDGRIDRLMDDQPSMAPMSYLQHPIERKAQLLRIDSVGKWTAEEIAGETREISAQLSFLQQLEAHKDNGKIREKSSINIQPNSNTEVKSPKIKVTAPSSPTIAIENANLNKPKYDIMISSDSNSEYSTEKTPNPITTEP